jgi:hypothetical protein
MPPNIANIMQGLGGPGGFDPSALLRGLGGAGRGPPDLSAMLG